MSKKYYIRNSKNTPEMSPVDGTQLNKMKKEVCVELTDEELKLMRSYADLKVGSTPSQILKAFVKFGVKLPFKHNRNGRI
jgi:hypothetical protein